MGNNTSIAAIPAFPLPISYIETVGAFNQCIAQLSTCPSFAFDLEFDRDRFTYGFDLCLIQIATTAQCFIIDPIIQLDLLPLWQFFEAPSIQKIVHCPGEDLRLLHSIGCYPKNIVDTEVVAKLLNYEQTSLANLLQKLCGITLNKHLQKSNWGRRPLTKDQIEYAAFDVVYLFQLKEILLLQASQKALMPYILEEFDSLSTTIYSLQPKTNFLKPNDYKYLPPYDQFVLNGMYQYRDALAREFNKPAHQMMDESLLRPLAFGEITFSQWENTKGVHPHLKQFFQKQALFNAIELLHQQAEEQQLSTQTNEGKYFTMEEKLAYENNKLRQDYAKNHVFIPIQKQLQQRFGEFATRHLFSLSLINDIITRKSTLADIKTAYRKQLIIDTAAQLGLDVSEW